MVRGLIVLPLDADSPPLFLYAVDIFMNTVVLQDRFNVLRPLLMYFYSHEIEKCARELLKIFY